MSKDLNINIVKYYVYMYVCVCVYICVCVCVYLCVCVCVLLHPICLQFYIINTSLHMSKTFNSLMYKAFYNSDDVCVKTELLLSQVYGMLQSA